MAQEQVIINLEARDNATGIIGALSEALRKLGGANREVDKLAQQFSKTMKNAGDIMSTGETKAQMFARQYLETQKALADAPAKMNEIADAANNMGNKVQKAGVSFGTLTKSFVALAGIQLGAQAVGNFFRDSIASAQEYQTKLIGLQTIANNFGISQSKIKEAVQSLTQDGMMNQVQATEALTNVMSSYVTDVDQAVQLTEMFKDFAASGGDASLSLGQKVAQLGESFLTEMSILGNNAGMQENWNEIIKVGEQVTGKKYEALNKLEQQQLKIAGVTAIHARAEGALDAFMKTNVGTIQQARANYQNLQTQLGNALIPALSSLAAAFNSGSSGGQVLSGAIKVVGTIALGVALTIRTLTTAIVQMFNSAKALFTLNFQEFGRLQEANSQEMLELWADHQTALEKIWNESGDTIQGVYAGVPDWASEASQKASKAHRKMLEDLKKETESFERELEKRNRDFERSLADVIWAHQDKVETIKAQLSEETADFEKNNARRVRDYERSLEDMAKANQRKIRDINDDIVDENEEYARNIDKIQQEIREEEQKGIMLFGQWNSQADQDRLADLRRRLEEEAYQHDQKLQDLQQKLDDETTDYAEALAEKKTIFEEETQAAADENAKRKSDLEASLKEEQEILKAHAAEVAMIKDMQKEDDITRLVRQNDEEVAEMNRAHQERMANIVQQAQEQGAAYGGGVRTAAKPDIDGLGDDVDNFLYGEEAIWEDSGFKSGDVYGNMLHDSATPHFKNVENSAKDSMTFVEDEFKKSGERTGKSWIQNITSSIADAAKKVIGFAKDSKILDMFNPFASLSALQFQHGGIVPGGASQPIPAILHGGERIVPRSGVDVNSRNGLGVTINMTGPVSMNSEQDVELLAEKITRMIGRSNELERLGVGR